MPLPKTILIIDDDKEDIEILIEAAQTIHSTIICTSYSNAREGLKFLKTTQIKPEYLFLDLNMPYMSGKECLAAIKSEPTLANIKIIIYSSLAHEFAKKSIEELDNYRFLPKPYSISDLCAALQEVFV